MVRLNTKYDFPFLELVGEGENISDEMVRVYFSKSALADLEKIGVDVIGAENGEIFRKFIDGLELYKAEKGHYVLTRKKNKNTITIEDYIKSSYRGTSGIEEVSSDKVKVVAATGTGRIREHTQFIATIPEGEWLIVFTSGRYEVGYIVYKNINGTLDKKEFIDKGKYLDLPSVDEVKLITGLVPPCEVIEDCE